MTEIQFLLDLILNCKLPKAAKEKCLTRIGEVEARLAPGPSIPLVPISPPGVPLQAASTQRLLEQKPLIMPPVPGPTPAIDKETGRAMISTGNGTFGPKKW